MKVFIDTSAFLALFIASEAHHQEIKAIYKRYLRDRVHFHTSTYVLDELYTRLIYDFGKVTTQRIIKILDTSIAQEEIAVLDVDRFTFKKAQEVMIKFADHQLSFTDATSFTLIKDLALDQIFTLDADFKKIGLKTAL